MRTRSAVRHFQAIAAWLAPAALLALVWTYVFVGDRTPWGEWLTIWPPIGWAVLFFIRSLIMWLERRRALAVVTAVGAVLFAGFLSEVAPVVRRADPARAARLAEARARPPHATSAVPLRIVSWNVAGGAPLSELEALQPDLCLLQEIGNVRAVMQTSTFWRGFHWFAAFDPGTLTRHAAIEVETGKVGPWTEPQLLVISLPNGVRLLVANVRLVLPSIVISIASGGDFAGVTAGHRERLAQYPRLVSLLRTVADRHGADEILLAGDFNTPGGMPSLSPLQPMLRDAWREAGIGWGATMTADMPVSRIDQCWVSEGVEVIGATVRRAAASDHRLLVVDMLVHPRPGVSSGAATLD